MRLSATMWRALKALPLDTVEWGSRALEGMPPNVGLPTLAALHRKGLARRVQTEPFHFRWELTQKGTHELRTLAAPKK